MYSKMIQDSPAELEVFASTYEVRSKHQIGESGRQYLRNAQVWAYYSKGQLLGGYAISTLDMNPSFRYLDLLDTSTRLKVLQAPQLHDLRSVAEITFTFFVKKANWFQRARALSASLNKAIASGKKYVLGGGIVKAFSSRMSAVLTDVLYRGQQLIYGEQTEYIILAASTSQIPTLRRKAWIKELWRLMLRRLKTQ